MKLNHQCQFPSSSETQGSITFPTFSWVITSDPQYPRTLEGGSSGNPSLSEAQIRQQYAQVNTYRDNNGGGRNNVPVFINGDITEYYHGGEISKMKSLMSILGPSVYYGLGNHDYDNNVDDCYNNGCARDAMKDLREHVQSFSTEAYDWWVSEDSETHVGSQAYTQIVGSFMFIQLHNHPAYHTYFLSRDGLKSKTFNITKSLDVWLENQLKNARSRSKFVIINMHRSPEDGNYPSADIEKFKRLVNDYDVKAIFRGHSHAVGNEGKFGNAAVFNSGAAFTKSFLVAEYDERSGVVNVTQAVNNTLETSPIGSFQVREPIVSPTLEFGFSEQPNQIYVGVSQTSQYYQRWQYANIQFQGLQPVRVDFTAQDYVLANHTFTGLTPNTEYRVTVTAYTETGESKSLTKTAKTGNYWDKPAKFCTSFLWGDWEANGWEARWQRPQNNNWQGVPMFEMGIYSSQGMLLKPLGYTADYNYRVSKSVYDDYKGQDAALGVRFVQLTDRGNKGLIELLGVDYLPIADWCSLQKEYLARENSEHAMLPLSLTESEVNELRVDEEQEA